jgi:molecular chaperone GrpE
MPSSPGTDRTEQPAPVADDGAPEHTGAPPAEGAAHEPRPDDGRDARELELREEVARLDDRYKRALADLDNYRKRSARELDRRVQEARDAVLREWLEAIDSVERAVRMDADGPLGQGMRAVLEQMEAILARHGVHRIGAPGEPFDPERHEAVQVRETDEVPERTVVDVLRAGFAVDGRVLRPAQVAVSRRPQTGS